MDDNIKGNRLCSLQHQLLLSLFNLHFEGSIAKCLNYRCSSFNFLVFNFPEILLLPIPLL
ncbi:hypothetical protein RchiOBHm_Chr6g0268711 [Rosa chinensis]|uniref:Uncharacterized protein n=1 Tax=Rosa chinensis TaxID=74649 RepID=A0A2P6PQ95_ROSCH|nr:hypothetical protein RchiOBHm_Chr6g0268711 [Rosa chinensis]